MGDNLPLNSHVSPIDVKLDFQECLNSNRTMDLKIEIFFFGTEKFRMGVMWEFYGR